MNILFVSPEVFPFARAGGLGDVSHYLPSALADRGHHLWVVTPKYRQTEEAGHALTLHDQPIPVPLSWQEKSAQLFTTTLDNGIEALFVGCDELYDREGLYGNEYGDYEDNAERFIFFCRAVMEITRKLDLRPDVIHCHDWPTGLIPVYVKTLYKDMFGPTQPATVFTFHNLGSQGTFWHYAFAMTGLGWELFTPEGLEYHGQLNMTKAGLVSADLVTTVSRRYAQEVLTPEYAFGLEGVLRTRQAKTCSVLNGVDYSVWNPAIDPEITANYTVDALEGKRFCRADLVRTFGLEDDGQPIIAVISRLLDRKGFDLINAGMNRLLEMPMKMVFMGRGEDKYHILLNDLASTYPGRIGVKIAYDKNLAHRIMAGADIFLMPSRYEPCGLEQLYGLKYGTVPVVRATGGLDDTVVDVIANPEAGTGFKFSDYRPDALQAALTAAVELFHNKPLWQEIVARGMHTDFSWAKSAAEYEAIYLSALKEIEPQP
jgi:starch synthase